MEYHITAGSKTKAYIESLMPSLIDQLKLNNSKKLLAIRTDRETEHPGTTIPLMGIDTVLVVLRPSRDRYELGVTLAHEMVHVAQMVKGTLKMTRKGKKWKGKFYHMDYPYLQQPWEIQAFAKQELLLRRAIE
jgi:hypothetical protein